jgi:hypothetical protein
MKYQLAENDRRTLEQLKAEQALEISAADFVRNYLPFSAGKWSKILDAIDPAAPDSYLDSIKPDTARALLDDLKEILISIPRLRAQAERLSSTTMLDLTQFRAVKTAVDEATTKRNPERLVKYLAPTGGGKTNLCSYLRAKCQAKVVESREAWKRSYFTVLHDLASALGCRLNDESRPSAIEDMLIDFLANQRTVLVIDEAEFFGPAGINGLKLLLNKTRLVVVLCAIAAQHDKWNRYYPEESAQLDRRTHAVVRLSVISPEDTKKFFPPKQFENEDSSLARISEEATRFGAYSLVARVAHILGKTEKADSKEVENAIKRALRAMNRTPSR